MGKMKEVWQQMMDDNWKGTPEEYLKFHVERMDSIKKTKILCPNCMDEYLLQEDTDKMSCPKCDTNFEYNNGTLKFI